MDPLSASTRKRYFLLFVISFVVVIPFAILYASGYRLDQGFSLISTGGLSISAPQSNVQVSLNGRDLGETSLFDRSFYEDNLEPDIYAVSAIKEGYYPWYKRLVVEPYLVTDAQIMLVPQQLEMLELIRGGAATTSTTTRSVTRVEYDEYLQAFAPEVEEVVDAEEDLATSTLAALEAAGPLPDDTQGGLALYIEEGNVRVRWTRSASSIPSYLCKEPSSCVQEVFIEKGKETTVNARFYGGGVLYTTEAGLYLSEIDVRPTPLLVPIYSRRGADFRIVNSNLIVKDGTKLYQIFGL